MALPSTITTFTNGPKTQMNEPRHKTALIAGVTGAIGTAVARELVQHEDWTVYGLSRHAAPSAVTGVHYLGCDLACETQTEQVVRSLKQTNRGPTHIFYCGRATHAEQTLENVEGNLELLRSRSMLLKNTHQNFNVFIWYRVGNTMASMSDRS